MDRSTKLKLKLAGVLAGTGALLLVLLFYVQDFPDIRLWALFAAALVMFEWNAVEVNDRLWVSPSVMVTLTAAVVFGAGSATLGAAAMAALGLLTPADLRGRRWFQPLANFGQFVITATVAVWVLELFLPADVTADNLWRVAAGTAVAATVYLMVQYTIVSWVVHTVYQRRELRPWAQMAANKASHLAMGFLGGLLGATYVLVGPATLPLIFTAYFVGHLAVAAYGELREAQEATLRGFVKALEAKDLYTRGHTERVAHFAELIGEQLRYNPTQLQRLRWAALIHDVGKLAVPRELIRKKARLTEEEYSQMQRHVHVVEDILAEVEFLHPMVHIASGHHAHYDGNGYTGATHNHGEPPSQEMSVLAVADAFDAMTSTRSYRMALTQEYAFAELEQHAGTQFDPEVVAALVAALERTKERYGSTALADENEARRLAETMEGYRIYG